MAAMREWLDRTRYEPTKFTCDHDGDALVVSVDFVKAEEPKSSRDTSRVDSNDDRRPLLREICKNDLETVENGIFCLDGLNETAVAAPAGAAGICSDLL